MKAFKKITSTINYLPIPNIDTDMIIPKQYLKTIKRTGLGNHLFAEMRFDAGQSLDKNSQILVTAENFGCGSSREHAVWSLMDFGIQVIIAPSFADIFYNNSFKNGLLPIILAEKDIQQLVNEKATLLTVDLEAQCISTASLNIPFFMDSFRRESLLQGLDEIGETLLFAARIAAFEEQQRQEQPWLYTEKKRHA